MKRLVTIAGIGEGSAEGMTQAVRRAAQDSDVLIGARRMLDAFPEKQCTFCATDAQKIRAYLDAHPAYRTACVAVSGDTGFYSGARGLLEALAGTYEARVLCGVSSPQALCARLGIPWQDAVFASAHGRKDSLIGVVRCNAKVLLLTGGERGPDAICRELCGAGLGGVEVAVGEALSYPEERVTRGTAEKLCGQAFTSLSVMLIQNARPMQERAAPGIPDSAFIRGKVPMTKFDVRCACIARMGLAPDSIVWDIGAGTGAVSVEAALLARYGAVYAVERKPEALELICANREKFGAYSLYPVEGEAPAALEVLPAPEAVFIGGTAGSLDKIMASILDKNPRARVVCTAVTLETVAETMQAFSRFALEEIDHTQIAVTGIREAGRYHMMEAKNPIWIFSGTGGGGGSA